MRRVIRILGRVGAGVSLLLCVAVVCLWVRSYSRPRNWTRGDYSVAEHELKAASIYSCRGWVAAVLTRQTLQPGTISEKKNDSGQVEVKVGGWSIAVPMEWTGEDIELGSADLPPAEHWWEKLGVYAQSRPTNSFGDKAWMSFLILPYWVLFLTSAIGPGVWSFCWWRRRRGFGEGKCPKCGYDLRESPGRCPECGAENVVSSEKPVVSSQ